MRSWLRRILLAGAALLLVVAGALALLQTPSVATWLGRRLVGLAPLASGVRVDIGRVSGNWVSGLTVDGLRLRNEQRELATIRSVHLRYHIPDLAGAHRQVRKLMVDGATIRTRRDSAGWDIARVLRQSTDTAGGGSFSIDSLELRNVDLVAELASDSLLQVEHLQLRARDVALGDTATATLDTVHARVSPPSDPPLWLDVAARGEATPEVFRLDPFRVTTDRSELAGRAVLPRSFDLPRIVDRLSVQVTATPLALEDLAAILPAAPGEGELQLDARIEAEGRRATGRLNARLGDARATMEGSTLLGSGGPTEYRVTGTIRDLDPTRISAGAPAGDLNAEIDVDLRGPTLAESEGTAEIRLADSRVGTTRLGELRLHTEVKAGRADIDLRALVEAGRVRATGWARPFDSIPSYRLTGTATELTGTDSLARLLAGSAGDPSLEIGFRLSGSGISADEARLRGRAEVVAARSGGDRTPVGSVTFAVANRRVDARPELLVAGGRVSANLSGRLGESVTYELRRGIIDSVDLGRLLGDSAAAPVSGSFTLRGRGTAPADASVVARMALDEIRYGARRIEQLTADARLDAGRARLSLRAGLQSGRIGVEAEGRPLDSVRTLDGRVQVELDRPGMATRLDGRFAASTTGTAPDSMRARLALELLPSRVNQADIRSGRVELTLNRGALRGELRMDAADGDLVTRLDGSTGRGRHRLRAEGALRLDRLARWTGSAERDGNLAARFTLEAGADSAGLTGLAGTITANGAIDSVRLDTLQVALSPSPGTLRLDTVVVRSNVAVVDGGGRVALREGAAADTLRLSAVLRDIAPLAALAGTDSLTLDSARLRLTVTGPAQLRQVRGEAEARRLLYAGNQVERLTLTGAAGLDSAGLAGVEGDLRLEGAALGTVAVRQARLAGRYDSLIALRVNAVLRDSIVLDAAMRGTATGDTIAGTLERLNLAEGGRRWALERPTTLALRPRQVEVDYFGLRSGEHRIALDGHLDRGGESNVALEVRRFDLDLLRKLGFAPVGGTLDGSLRLTGPANAPSLQGKVAAAIRPERGSELGRITSEFDWTRAGLRIDAAASHESGGRLTVAGTLPLRLTLAPKDTGTTVGVTRQAGDTLGLVVRADSFDLAFAEPLLPEGTAEELGGTVAVNGRVSGTMEKPLVDGTVRLTGFGATLPTLGVRYEKGELAGRLTGDRFELQRFRLVTDNDGELTARGNVGLAPLDDPRLDLTAELREFRVSRSPTLRTIATGKVRLEGTAAAPVLTGAMTLGRTDVYTGTETAAAAGVEEVELSPEDLQQLAREFGPAVLDRADEGPGLVDRFRLDLDVRLPRRVWFRRRETPKMDIEIAGRIQVTQEPGQPMQFFGKVSPLPGRGAIELYGRSFRMVDGDITLAGPAEATTLDVTVQYQVPTQADPGDDGILIDVAAAGRADSLELTFSSEPTMSQEDIISYIVTGRPGSENPLAGGGGGGESATEVGAEIALTRLSESVSGAAGEALGLDVFQIRQDGLRGLTLTAGRYVASRVFLSLQQPIQLSSDAQQGSGSTFGPGFELEYTVRRWLRANLRGGNVPPRFFFRGRYAF